MSWDFAESAKLFDRNLKRKQPWCEKWSCTIPVINVGFGQDSCQDAGITFYQCFKVSHVERFDFQKYLWKTRLSFTFASCVKNTYLLFAGTELKNKCSFAIWLLIGENFTIKHGMADFTSVNNAVATIITEYTAAYQTEYSAIDGSMLGQRRRR